MQRSIDASGMHKDDLTREVLAHFNAVTITDGLGHKLFVEKSQRPDHFFDSWLQITDHKGNVGYVYVGIGR